MIKIILSELDFDYELQALVNSFFSGQRSSVEVGQELTASSMKEILSVFEWKRLRLVCIAMSILYKKKLQYPVKKTGISMKISRHIHTALIIKTN